MDLISVVGFGSDDWGGFGRPERNGTAATEGLQRHFRRRQALTSSPASEHDDERRNTTRRGRRTRFGAYRRRRGTGRRSATEGGSGCFGISSKKALRRRRDQGDDGKSFCGGRRLRWRAQDAQRGSGMARRRARLKRRQWRLGKLQTRRLRLGFWQFLHEMSSGRGALLI